MSEERRKRHWDDTNQASNLSSIRDHPESSGRPYLEGLDDLNLLVDA
jgi:hypothetical protein